MTRPTPSYEPLPATDGGAAWELVELRDGKPACKRHGAMNKVSPSPPEGGATRGACKSAAGRDAGNIGLRRGRALGIFSPEGPFRV